MKKSFLHDLIWRKVVLRKTKVTFPAFFLCHTMALAATPTSNNPSMSLTSNSTNSSNSNNSSNELRFSGHTLDKATKAKLTLENYYSTLISQHKERKERWKRLEDSLRVRLFPWQRNQHKARTEVLNLKEVQFDDP